MIAIVGLPNGAPGGPWGPRGPWGPWAPQGPIRAHDRPTIRAHDRPTIGSYSSIGSYSTAIGGTVRGSAIALFTFGLGVNPGRGVSGSYFGLSMAPFHSHAA